MSAARAYAGDQSSPPSTGRGRTRNSSASRHSSAGARGPGRSHSAATSGRGAGAEAAQRRVRGRARRAAPAPRPRARRRASPRRARARPAACPADLDERRGQAGGAVEVGAERLDRAVGAERDLQRLDREPGHRLARQVEQRVAPVHPPALEEDRLAQPAQERPGIGLLGHRLHGQARRDGWRRAARSSSTARIGRLTAGGRRPPATRARRRRGLTPSRPSPP